MSRQFAKASILLALILGGSSPALAGRGTQIDAPIPGSGPCTLGSTCNNYVDISASGIFTRAYIYEQGIVSIDALLPTNWDPSNPSTYGSGIWFTPGYSPGTIYQVNAYFDVGFGPDGTPPSWGFNFFTLGSPVVDPDTDSALAPHMQVLLSSGSGTFLDPADDQSGWDGVSAVLAYLPGFDPPADAWIGFNWGGGATQLVRNADGLLVGPQQTDTDFVSTSGIAQAGGGVSPPTQFVPLHANGGTGAVPEPGTWAMMLLGFGFIGWTLRRQSLARVSLA